MPTERICCKINLTMLITESLVRLFGAVLRITMGLCPGRKPTSPGKSLDLTIMDEIAMPYGEAKFKS